VAESQEAVTSTVAEDYQTELGRPADTTAANYWEPQVVSLRQHDEDVEGGIAGADEYSTAIAQELPTVGTDDPNAAAFQIDQGRGRFPDSDYEGSPTAPASQAGAGQGKAAIKLQPDPPPLLLTATPSKLTPSAKLFVYNTGSPGTLLHYQ